MKNILITGGAGFIGRHMSELYLSKGYRVIAIDNLSTGNIDNIKYLKNKFKKNNVFTFIKANVEKYKKINLEVKSSYLVIHLAAAVGVTTILEKPIESMKSNLKATEIILEMCRKYNKPIFFSSTSEVYGKSPAKYLVESGDIVYGASKKIRWSYAASKLLDEFLALSFYNEYKLKVVIGRFFNTVGRHQSDKYGMVIPRLIKQAKENKPLTVHGSGQQSRTFTDVDEVCQCVYQLMKNRKAYGEVVNIGGSQEIKIIDLAKKIISLTKSKSKIKIIPYKKAYSSIYEDMNRRYPSTKKLKKLIGKVPNSKVNDILKKIIV
jgi:UDP-glucose 4-epimerase